MGKFSIKDTPWSFLFLAGFIASFGIWIYTGITYPNLAFSWNLIPSFDSYNEALYKYNLGLLSFERYSDVFIKSYLISADSPKQPFFSQVVLIAGIWLGLAGLLALVTEFGSKAFYIFIGGILILAYSLRLDFYLPFSFAGIEYIIPVLIVGASIIRHIRDQSPAFSLRFISYLTSIALLITLAIASQDEREESLLLFVENAIPGLYLFAAYFMLQIAVEIPAFFMELTSRRNSEKPGSNFLNFLAISVLYLATLLLFYFHISGRIDFELRFFSAFPLLGISILLGIRNFPIRLLSPGIEVQPVPGRMFFLSAAVVVCSFTAYLFASGNDLYIEAMEDFIMYTHIGGAIFFPIYILINFLSPAWENKPIYKIMFKPYRMGVTLLHITISLTAIVLFFASEMIPFSQLMSANMTQRAGIEYRAGNSDRAKALLDLAIGYTSRGTNQHFLYGNIYTSERELGKAWYHFEQSVEKNSNEYAVLNLARNYRLRDKWFESKDLLLEEWRKTPHPALALALGNLYNETSFLDSAAYYYGETRRGGADIRNAAEVNLSSVVARLPNENVREQWAKREAVPGMAANLSLIYPDYPINELLRDADKLADTFAIINNRLQTAFGLLTPNDLSQIKSLSDTWIFSYYRDKVLDKIQLHYLHQKDIANFQRINAELGSLYNSERKNHIYLHGSAALENRKWDLAFSKFTEADSLGFSIPDVEWAILYAALGKINQALEKNSNLPNTSLNDFLIQRLSNDSTYYWNTWVADSRTVNSEKLRVDILKIQNESLRNAAFLQAAGFLLENGLLEKLGPFLTSDSWQNTIDLELLIKIRHDYEFLMGSKTEGVGVLWSTADQEILKQARNLQSFEEKKEAYLIAAKNYWNDGLVLTVAAELQKMDAPGAAYELLLEAHLANPYSVEILKAYILICKRMSLENFLEIGLRRLQNLISEPEFKNFQKLVSAQKDTW